MENGFSILMFFFAGALALYAAIMAITKDYNILPVRAQIPVSRENPEKYMLQMAKITALVAIAIALGAAISLWNWLAGLIVMLLGVIGAIWAGTKIIKKAQP